MWGGGGVIYKWVMVVVSDPVTEHLAGFDAQFLFLSFDAHWREKFLKRLPEAQQEAFAAIIRFDQNDQKAVGMWGAAGATALPDRSNKTDE